MPESAIVRFLVTERPATAAYILSRFDSPLAARIVSALPRDRRNAALCGLIAPHAISPRAGEVVEAALREMLKTSQVATGDIEGPARNAGNINNLEPDEAEDVMRAIGDYHSHTPILNRRGPCAP